MSIGIAAASGPLRHQAPNPRHVWGARRTLLSDGKRQRFRVIIDSAFIQSRCDCSVRAARIVSPMRLSRAPFANCHR
jgi:hypothetical protein